MTAAESPPAAPHRLLRNRDFQLLLWGQGLSVLGSGAAALTLPLLVLAETGSPLRVGLVEAVWTGAVAVACLVAGPLSDRYDRRAVMLWCEYGRVAVSAAFAAAIALGRAPLPVLLGAGVLLGLLTAPFGTAGLASVQKVVPPSRLAAALALNRVRGQLAGLLGPLAGGALFALDASLPYWLNALSFLVSAATVHALRTPLDAVERAGPRWWRAFAEGVRFLWRDRVLRRLTLIASAQNFAVDGVALTVVVVSGRHGTSSLTIGLLYDFWAAGALVGALLAPRLVDRVPYRTVLLACGAVCSLVVPLMAVSAAPAALAPLLAACAAAVSLSGSVMTYAQVVRTPDTLQGRVHGGVALLLLAAPPLGSALAGLLLERFPDEVPYLAFGALLLLLTAVTSQTSPTSMLSPRSA
ncbi:MFS transporter [Streptomyces sp. MNP-20]|uniref:MFS transporter n=1 Tax=Streptomyces sp. MNP-20 TaxID=2721165 RepID=UPI001556B690|nr:MFS transporter [Streptomyces sp. MNP-20]